MADTIVRSRPQDPTTRTFFLSLIFEPRFSQDRSCLARYLYPGIGAEGRRPLFFMRPRCLRRQIVTTSSSTTTRKEPAYRARRRAGARFSHGV